MLHVPVRVNLFLQSITKNPVEGSLGEKFKCGKMVWYNGQNDSQVYGQMKPKYIVLTPACMHSALKSGNKCFGEVVDRLN